MPIFGILIIYKKTTLNFCDITQQYTSENTYTNYTYMCIVPRWSVFDPVLGHHSFQSRPDKYINNDDSSLHVTKKLEICRPQGIIQKTRDEFCKESGSRKHYYYYNFYGERPNNYPLCRVCNYILNRQTKDDFIEIPRYCIKNIEFLVFSYYD